VHAPDDADRVISTRLRVMQIIASVLMGGVLSFLGISLFVVQQQGRGLGQAPGPMISILALAFFMTAALLWSFVPAQLARGQVGSIAAGTWTPAQGTTTAAYTGDTSKLVAVFQTKMIIAYALLEGAAFFGCIAYLLEAEALALVAVVGPVALMLLTFPTRPRLDLWLQQQQARIDELRQAGGWQGET
jgi:hypothetical protein